MKLKFVWEALDAHTLRVPTAGGWLVRHHSRSGSVGITFVPDPEHAWEVEVSTERVAEARERLEELEKSFTDPYREQALRAEMEEEILNLRQFIADHG